MPDAEQVPTQPRNFFYASSDGLKLHAADYGDRLSPWLPVVCLPGLSRTARDFHDLAVALSSDRQRPRRVLAFDYRGRGGSEWDKDHAGYNPVTEMSDVLDGMAAAGIARAVIVGTSRGGIIAMMMGVARPTAIAGVVLNDIGPVIEPRGLARIKAYVGRMPSPEDWDDAVAILQRLHGAQFAGLEEEDWAAFARATYRDDGGRPIADYDPALAKTFDGVEFDRPVPTLWDEFATLHAVPTLAIRGENSDLLSAETLAEMAARHPNLTHLTVQAHGHPPMLRGPSTIGAISSYVVKLEGDAPPAHAVLPSGRARFDSGADGTVETPDLP